MTDKTPPAHPDAPGMRGSYGQRDFAQSAQRNRLRKDQHYAPKGPAAGEVPDPYGEGAFAGGGQAGTRQSGYGEDFGNLEGAQRHEKQVSELDNRKAGTPPKSGR